MELYGSNGKPKKRENLSAEKRGSLKKMPKEKAMMVELKM